MLWKGCIEHQTNDSVDRNFKSWSQKTANWSLYARLQSAADVHAGDVYYHRSCYIKLQNDARSADRDMSAQSQYLRYHDAYDELIMAQLAAFVVESMNIFAVGKIIDMYRRKMSERGTPCEGSYSFE